HLVRMTRIRNRWGEVLREGEETFAARRGPNAWEVRLPPLPGGIHFVDQIIAGERGTEGWGSFSIVVSPFVRIDEIAMRAAFFEAGEPIEGTVLLSRPVREGESFTLSIALEDGYGRIFSRERRSIRAGATRIPFSIPQGTVASWGARVRISLGAGDRVLHRNERAIRLRRPDRGAFPIAIWGAIPGYGGHVANLELRRLGFTAVLANDPLPQARDDLGWMTFGGGRGATIHSLGDEIPIPRARKGEAFAAFLRSRYGTLDELNRTWGASFCAWEDAEPSVAVADGDPASFVRMHDARACGEWMFAERIRRDRERIAAEDPGAAVGPEGSPVGDPERTLAEATFWGPYLTARDNLLVDALGRPGLLRGNWFGGYVEDRRVPTRNRHVLWRSILGGNNMIAYFHIDLAGGLLAPDLTPMPFFASFRSSWDRIRGGLGALLARSEPAGNPVALLHSQASQHIGQAGGAATDPVAAHEFLLAILGDAGYAPQYVASGQVKAGRLRRGDIEALFLIQAHALSDEEIDEIRAFAAAGGRVIADRAPAAFNGRCRLRPSRPLDDLFGIEGPAPEASLRALAQQMPRVRDVETPYGRLRLRGVDESVRARPNDRAILLGGVLWKEARDDRATIETVRRLIADGAGVAPGFRVAFEPALDRLGVRVFSFRRDGIRIDAVLPPEETDPAIPVIPHIAWSDAKHTYDLVDGTYLGERAEIAREVERASPLIVARLDYRVGRIAVACGSASRPGETLPFTCRVEDAEGHPRAGHVVRIRVVGPDGEERPPYAAILPLDGSLPSDGPLLRGTIPFAFNDPPGTWTIEATDIVSGISGAARITLEGDPGG
ncbi:MAG: hypothetical protein JXP34_16945, partial [Planctomycetes bacterium]|nr:hypothetical protein [Planctomycetota bacterium]